ncbi:MAG: GGDEF domain-containing protein, partial [Burkholderiales bacterium]
MKTPTPSGNSDVISSYHERIYYWLAIAGAVVLFPFSLNNFLQDRTLLGVGTLVVVLVLAINARSIGRGGKPPVPAWLFFALAIASVGMSIKTLGVVGLFWCYPAMALMHFLLMPRMANILSVALIAVAAPLTFRYVGADIAARVLATMVLLLAFNNIFLGIINRLQRQLYDLSIADPLTGAFNRRHLLERVDETVAQHDRYGHPVSPITIDVDHFKSINDELGHGAGDKVLIALVRKIQERLRKGEALFRTGGEEFAVLMPNTGIQDAAILAESLRKLVEAEPLLAGRPVTISLGAATREKKEPVDHWMARCDAAIYASKSGGRNRVSLADSETGAVP